MDHLMTIVEAHGAPILFALFFLDQLGVPLPSAPLWK